MRKLYPLLALLVLLAVVINAGSAEEGTRPKTLEFVLAEDKVIFWNDTNSIVPGPGIVAGRFGFRGKTELYLKMLFMPNKADTAKILYAFDFTKMGEAARRVLIDKAWELNGINSAAVFIYAPQITGTQRYGFYGAPLVKLAYDGVVEDTQVNSVKLLKAALNTGAPKNFSLNVPDGVPVYFAIDTAVEGVKETTRLITYDYGGAFNITKEAALSSDRVS